jgi:Cdc6-like AAA superfamily ATPase
MHNAARDGDIQRCHPKTRRAILQQISDWVDDPSPNSQILWLGGSVGVGKTAVARTICETLNEQGRLAGDFFFCRVGGISRANTLFATIACQLAIAAPEIRQKIHEAFELDPTVIYKAIEVQLQKLIVEPLLFLFKIHPETLPFVIAIDGLDECQNRRDQRDIIRILGSVSRAYQPPLPVRFIICSRPESWILAGFDSVAIKEITLEDNTQAREDIRIYFEDGFGKILNGLQHKSNCPR